MNNADNQKIHPTNSGEKNKGTAMTRILIGLLIGAAAGALLGYFGQCSSGTCPLTATWWRGAIFGGIFGVLFASGK